MKQIKNVIAAMIAGWGLISDYQLPERVIAPFRMKIPSGRVLFCLPFAGVAAAMLVLIAAWSVSLIFSKVAGAIIFTIAGGALFFFKDSGSGFALLLSYAGARLKGEAPVVALGRSNASLGDVLRTPAMMLAAVIFMIFILGMLFLLFFRGAGFWFAAVIAADAFVQGRLCLENDRYTKLPFIRAPENGINYLALSGVIIAVIMLMVFPAIASLGAIVVLWVWFWRELPRAGEFEEGLTSDWITMYGFWASVLTLLCGMGLL